MATFDQMIIDDRDLANRYFGENNLDDLDDDHYLFSQPTTTNQQPFRLNSDHQNDQSTAGLFGRRVFLESPSLGNKEDEELYRYVPSRLSDHISTVAGPSAPAPAGDTLIDSLDFELDLLRATNTRPLIPYRTNAQLFEQPKPPVPLTQLSNPLTPMTNMRRADPRQDPLLGPLLAELDAMSTQQQRLTQPAPPAVSAYRRNSVPYEGNFNRPPPPPAPTQTNRALPSTNHRAVNDPLFDNELYDSLEPREQQRPSIPFSAPNVNSSNQPRQQQQRQQQPPPPPPPQAFHTQQQQQQLPNRRSNMNSTDIFMPLSYNDGPTFLSNFGPDDQLFQQPLFNAMGQNYVPNTRPPPPPQQQPQQQQQQREKQQEQSQFEQRNTTFDQSYARMSPPPRSNYVPSQQPPPNNNNNNNNDNDRDPFSEYHDMYGPSQYSRPPPAPSQQRPPFSQQQRTVPQPPPSQQQQQQQHRRPPSSSQQYERPNYNQEPYRSAYDSNNQEMFFTDHNDEQLDQFADQQQHLPPISHRQNDQQNDQDTRRQAVWNDLQRTNAKVQEKNAKKRESANRREQLLKGNYGSNHNLYANSSQQSSAQSKMDTRSQPHRRPPPMPTSKTNFVEENVDMIKNKENFYHRYPAKKYENLYSKRKDLAGEGQSDRKREQSQNIRNEFEQSQSSTMLSNPGATYSDPQHRSSLPVTINLNPDNNSQGGNLPGSITIPLDSQVTREGDKISVNIDLRLVDLQTIKQQQQQQQNDHPDWSGLDPLDRHIRKLERSLDQSLPPTHSPRQQQSPSGSNPNLNASLGRYGKTTTGAGQGGYSPPNYRSEQYQYNYGEKGQEENSYLSKMNHVKQGPHFKPYTGQDYEQFKKNNGFGRGFLGFDFDNPSYKEKSDKLIKTKEYAQQVETRNKKKLAEGPRRTLSDTRFPVEESKTQRALEYARVSTRHKPSSGPITRSIPPDMNGGARRPTEVLHRPPPAQKQPLRSGQHDDNELVERLAQRHERDKAQVQGILNPSQKRREQVFSDDGRGRDIERLAQERSNQRRLSPPKQGSTAGSTSNTNARRPLRFDKPLVADEGPYTPPQPPSQQQYRPVQPQQDHQLTPRRQNTQHQEQYQHTQTKVDELANRHNDEKMLMEAIRQELSERPLGDDEELIVVEQ